MYGPLAELQSSPLPEELKRSRAPLDVHLHYSTYVLHYRQFYGEAQRPFSVIPSGPTQLISWPRLTLALKGLVPETLLVYFIKRGREVRSSLLESE